MAVRLKIRVPIGIDETADHPALTELLVVAELDSTEEAFVTEIDIRGLALQQCGEGCKFLVLLLLPLAPFLAIFDPAEPDLVGAR